MSIKNAQEAIAAVEMLETSHSYEPSRWTNAYGDLRSLEREFVRQLRPYLWIAKIFGLVGLVSYLAMIVWSFAHIVDYYFVFSANILLNSLIRATLWAAPPMLIAFGGWLTLRIAARRHPLLLQKSRIERATRRFRKLAGEPIPDDDE